MFTGSYKGPGRGDSKQGFERNLARIFGRSDVPRLSGVQIKAPMSLEPNGILAPSKGTSFTDILKPAGTSDYDIVEWLDMELGRIAQFVTPETALVEMPDGMPLALFVERFDIRSGPDDHRLLAMEDLCSVLGLAPEDKYTGTMERVARAVRPLSTKPDEDLLLILRRALFAWLIADGDMHLKDMALLKTAEPGERLFRSVRIAPLYDAVTTRVFPTLKNDHLAIKLNGKDDRLRRADFRALATNAGLKSSDADQVIDEMLERLSVGLTHTSLPKTLDYPEGFADIAAELLQICADRIAKFF